MTSSEQCTRTAYDKSGITREDFLRWHYSHTEIYLELKRIALKEKTAGREALSMSDLFAIYDEFLMHNGPKKKPAPRHYARFYMSLLSSHPCLWAFLRLPVSPDRDSIGE